MSSLGSKRHTHRYMRSGPAGNVQWYCSLPNCTHFMPRNVNNGSVLGKNSLCWNCGEEFVLDERAMKMEQPICFSCTPEGKAVSEFNFEEFEKIHNIKKEKQELDSKSNEHTFLGDD